MSDSSEGDPEGGEGSGRVAGVVAEGSGEVGGWLGEGLARWRLLRFQPLPVE
jgi:hypothetical protein